MYDQRKLEKHFVATGFVLNKDRSKMLMVHHRKLDKWVAPGGHIEPDETPTEAALREVLEETGVEAEIVECSNVKLTPEPEMEAQLEPPFAMLSEYIPQHGDTDAHIHLDFIFICEADDRKPISQQIKEVKDVRWMTWEEVEQSNTFDSIRSFAKIMHD